MTRQKQKTLSLSRKTIGILVLPVIELLLIISVMVLRVGIIGAHPECQYIPADVGPCGFWSWVGWTLPWVLLMGLLFWICLIVIAVIVHKLHKGRPVKIHSASFIVYTIIFTIFGTSSIVYELFSSDLGVYRFVSVGFWIILLVAAWLSILEKQIGSRLFWQLAAVLAIPSDLYYNVIIASSNDMMTDYLSYFLSFVFLLPLYINLFNFAFTQKFFGRK